MVNVLYQEDKDNNINYMGRNHDEVVSIIPSQNIEGYNYFEGVEGE